MNFKYKVVLREFERGWQTRVVDIKAFDTLGEAIDEIGRTNSRRTRRAKEDLYILAEPVNFTL